LTTTTLDELGGKIPQFLSNSCRISFNGLGNYIGLTTKSVKARVKKMQASGVIDGFIVKVNSLVLGNSKFCLLVLKINSNAADLDHIRHILTQLGDILYTGHVLGDISLSNS